MKVDILTSPRVGGPLNWSRGLVRSLRNNGVDAHYRYEVPRLLKALASEDADIVHTTIPLPIKLWRKPLVVTVKGDYTIENRLWRILYPNTIKQADTVTVPSQYLKERLNLKDAVVVPNAVFPEDYITAKHNSHTPIKLVTVMDFHFKDRAKGIMKLLDILGGLGKPCEWRIIGGGRYLEDAEVAIYSRSKGIYQLSVRFMGFLPPPLVRTQLSESDIFIYYSEHDNFPHVILEAMASGLPVITNQVGAMWEMIPSESYGYVATTDAGYIDALRAYMDSPLRREFVGKMARRRVTEQFSWDKVVGEYIKIYKGLCNG